MRLQVLADLHLEFGFAEIPATGADVVVLAGDIHLGREGRKWARSTFPDTPIVYVLGNHEFYRHSIPDLIEQLRRETDGSQIYLVENQSVEIGGYTFLGCTLWTDFELTSDKTGAIRAAEEIMSDYSIIQYTSEKRALRARDTIRLHSESVDWLRAALATCDPSRTVVVTHHAPSAKSEAPYHANSPLRSAFASSLDLVVRQSGVPLWIHGHTHYNVDYVIGSTRVLTNQRGYPDEPCHGFDPKMIVEI